MAIKIINKVPHAILLLNSDKTVKKVFPRSNGMVRVVEETIDYGFLGDIPITATRYLGVEQLPDEEEGVHYIVSSMVMAALPTRKDFLVPKGIVRDSEGNIIGCTSLDVGYQ